MQVSSKEFDCGSVKRQKMILGWRDQPDLVAFKDIKHSMPLNGMKIRFH